MLSGLLLKHPDFAVIDNIEPEMAADAEGRLPGPEAVPNLIANEGKTSICYILHGDKEGRTAVIFLDLRSRTLFYLDPWRISTGGYIDSVLDYLSEKCGELSPPVRVRFETNVPKENIVCSYAEWTAKLINAPTQAYVMLFLEAMLAGKDETGARRTREAWIEFFKRDNISDAQLVRAHAHFFRRDGPDGSASTFRRVQKYNRLT